MQQGYRVISTSSIDHEAAVAIHRIIHDVEPAAAWDSATTGPIAVCELHQCLECRTHTKHAGSEHAGVQPTIGISRAAAKAIGIICVAGEIFRRD